MPTPWYELFLNTLALGGDTRLQGLQILSKVQEQVGEIDTDNLVGGLTLIRTICLDSHTFYSPYRELVEVVVNHLLADGWSNEDFTEAKTFLLSDLEPVTTRELAVLKANAGITDIDPELMDKRRAD